MTILPEPDRPNPVPESIILLLLGEDDVISQCGGYVCNEIAFTIFLEKFASYPISQQYKKDVESERLVFKKIKQQRKPPAAIRCTAVQLRWEDTRANRNRLS